MDELKFPRRQAHPIGDSLKPFLRASGLADGMNVQVLRTAWNAETGLQEYTRGFFFRDGTLWVTLASSALRSQVHFQRQDILSRLNACVRRDPLFTGDPAQDFVKKLILK